ncbi:hypothetical protein PMAYCL1PPCAC_05208, partial [Pristionchus mayeri]
TLLTIHFIYRYLAVVAPEKLRIFSNWKFFASLAFYLVAHACLYTYVILALIPEYETLELTEARSQLAIRIDRTIDNGWLSISYWRNGQIVENSLLLIVIANFIQGINLTITIGFAILTFRAIRRTANHASKSSNKFQMQLFVAICAQ